MGFEPQGWDLGIDFFLSDVFCFTYFLSGFLFRVRGRVGVRDGVGDGFRVRVRFRASVRASWGQGFIHHNPNLLELKLRPSGKTRKKQKIVIGLVILSKIFYDISYYFYFLMINNSDAEPAVQ